MAVFRKKPVEIEAVQYGPFSAPTLEMIQHLSGAEFEMSEERGFVIKTLEGDMTVSIGDWVIKGVKGEYYPCKPDIFAATYDAVSG